MQRRFLMTSAIAVVLAAAFLPGSGLGSSGNPRATRTIPAGLAAAIRARLGAGGARSPWAARVAEGPAFGVSVALSADGTTALVGVPDAGPLSTVFRASNWRNGEALIFHVSSAGLWSSTGTPAATLSPGSRAPFGAGSHVALSPDGTTAFVGAPSDGSTPAIYVFHVAAEDAWASSSAPAAVLRVFGSAGDGPSGPLAVSSDGTTLVVSAPYYNEFAPTAFVFHVASEGAWATTSTPTAALTPPDHGDGGEAVAISGDGTTVLLSDSVDYFDGGSAYIYHVAAEDSWASQSTPTARLSDASAGTGTDASDALGNSVALSDDGTVAFLGAEPYTSKPDYVDVFHVSGAGKWADTTAPTATLTNAAGGKGEYFAEKIAVSADGTTALVTAPFAASSRGAAYIFHVSDEGSWATSSAPTARVTDSGGRAGDALGFGTAFSADGATVLLGAPGFNWATGKADVFHAAGADSWSTSSTPSATLTNKALPKPVCVVPRLVGKSVSQAKDTLYFTNCLLGRVQKVHSTKKNRRRVLWQSRAPKRHVAPGSKINVKVGR